MSDSAAKLEGLVRSLNLIPYLRKHPDATPMEIARDLGGSHEDIMADLTRLTLSGVGNGPGELIDLVASWRGITLIDDQGLTAPLRLTPTEANALLLTLESLETMPGLVDHSAVTSAAAKLRAVTRAGVADADHPADENEAVGSAVARALADGVEVELLYYSASSDTTSTRIVSPVELFHHNGQTYLRALEDGHDKTFRLDRVRTARPTQRPAGRVPARAGGSDPFGFGDAARATLLIRSEATWLADYWEIELDADTLDQEWVRATMPYGSADWLIRFCLGQSDRVRLEKPTELAEEVTWRAKKGAERLG
ncbi:helix-turn-helix transcriptional regulator [Corynebacterium timonense]|uniref:Proteasome accessory factor C n=1 Tax=Corynebacterium timonense TaxID=441500 RepID=A0A1H1P7R4_9CORY|nr:WYL domain-containing protein [Corynebacterium timonense]SDS07281.1 proteasome accessory factor C [Corynebacterium timonense]